MLVATLLLIIGLGLLTYSADRLTYGAASLALAFGIPPFIIGMTVVSMGTALPALATALTAAFNGKMDMVVGTVVGSNIINILLILGCVSLIQPLQVRSDILRRELPLLIVISVFCGVILSNNYLSRMDGVFLLTTLAVFLWLMIKITRLSQREGRDSLTHEQEAELPQNTSQAVAILWLIVGLIILPIAAKMVIDNATVVARFLNISELLIGLTLLAIGTSLPELATSITGALKSEYDMALGNLIGSNIFNILLVLGVPALLAPGSFSADAFYRDYWVMLTVSIILVILCTRRKRLISHLAGASLLCGFIAYIITLFTHQYIK